LFASLPITFTHDPLQFCVPPVQLHCPPEQVEPGIDDEHDLPQLPQLFESVCVFTHAPVQTLSPLGHWHAPPLDTLAQS
jgi:hypothetical protein